MQSSNPRCVSSWSKWLLLVALVTALPAQSPGLQFAQFGKRHLPLAEAPSTAILTGDVDGDGDPDIVVGDQIQNRLYLNDGTGTFFRHLTGVPANQRRPFQFGGPRRCGR
jgi:hypothetical protein